MKKALLVLTFSLIVVTATHAALTSAINPLFISTVTPHLVLSNPQEQTRLSLVVPETIGTSHTQTIATEISYTHICTLDKNGKPTVEKTTVPYTRVSTTITRVSSTELLVEWKTRKIDKFNTYTIDDCTIEAPLWNVKKQNTRMLLNDKKMSINGWTIELSTLLPGIGARP